MSRSRRSPKPDPVDVALARILSDPNLRQSARQSAEAKLTERAHARYQSLGEYRQFVERLR